MHRIKQATGEKKKKTVSMLGHFSVTQKLNE